MNANLATLAYLASGVLFILTLRGLSSPATSRQGNRLGMFGMGLAVAVTLLLLFAQGLLDGVTLALIAGGVAVGGTVGAVIARRVEMTAMPQLVAFFHSLVGLAACLVAVAAIHTPAAYHIDDGAGIRLESLIELSVGLAIGAITFTGSLIAFAKLNGNMSGAPILLPARHVLNLALGLALVGLIVVLVMSGGHALWAFWTIFALALVAGVTLIIPIGGADMPVVISMLNSYSGWAAAALGFTLANITLIITGALVGSSGAILSYIMCKGMNRGFLSVILGGFGAEAAGEAGPARVETRPVKQGSAEDAGFIMKNASKVIIVPGYGMAVA
ncbi:MAG: NAD(P)(+) transhydrogenase (Re/Si-specific) subunit beta, partial [Alphaproteobacteria bacterium]|nr:NAD(P)(+) transhydrogenase (Re/Si-specific) subunit beta [Alphaproteobacteria bacterium]